METQRNEIPLQRRETVTKRKETAMTIQDVADQLDVSKKQVWKAVKDGQLEAVKTKRGKAWRYSISEDAAEAYRLSMEGSGEWEPVKERVETGNETRNGSQETEPNRNETETKQDETPVNDTETIKELFDRLEMSHRKQIFLEMQQQQCQKLLCEVNEDQHEREARAKEAEAKAELARQEADQAKAELEALRAEAEAKAKAEEALELMAVDLQTLKTEMATKEMQWQEARKPWYKKLFRKSS